MRPAAILCICILACGGCGGYYILTVPDQLAPAGGDATAVVRLQRNDFIVLALAVKSAAMRYRIGDGAERASYTDKLGYAAAMVPAPAAVGRYPLRVSHLDREGEEVAGESLAFVWDASRAAVAVDLDCLPWRGKQAVAQGRAALTRIAGDANVLYLTRREVAEHRRLHEELAKNGYPDGPILLWQRQRWHIVRSGRLNLPRVVVESRLVSQLAEVRKVFAGLTVGVGDSQLAARAFAGAGLRPVVVGRASVDCPNLSRRESWADLASRGL